MKKYEYFGELLIDYREFMQISQNEFAAQLQVDPRTIQRWERNETLIKPNKETLIANVTLFPYQVIRNLNSPEPIPTYYDLHVRKYALTEIGVEMPDANWFKDQLNHKTDRLVQIDFEKDYEYLVRFMEMHRKLPKNIGGVIKEGIKVLPELNLILKDDSGYYAGHLFVIPISEGAYKNLRNMKTRDYEIKPTDVVNYKLQKTPIFFAYDVIADCNENFYNIINPLINFLRALPNENYVYCNCAYRHDNYELTEKAGLKIIWEEHAENQEVKGKFAQRFLEGNFSEFLNS